MPNWCYNCLNVSHSDPQKITIFYNEQQSNEANLEFIDVQQTEDNIIYHLDTRWEPPEEWFQQLSSDYPDFHLKLDYYTPDSDEIGYLELKDGVFSKQDWELSQHTWDNCDQHIVTQTISEILESSSDNNPNNLTEQVIRKIEYIIDDTMYLENIIRNLIVDKMKPIPPKKN